MKLTVYNSEFFHRKRHRLAAVFYSLLLPLYPAMAQEKMQAQSAVQETTTTEGDEDVKIPDEQLDSLVAPIALYPDHLLAQTLAASTYPLEIIQLKQWRAKNPDLKDKALADAVAQQNWDPSVQAMAALPEAMKQLGDNISWTTDLGNAFLTQQSDVMAAVQRMRSKAQGKGALQTSDKQVVETKEVDGKDVVVIEQADPEVVYVPSYNPTVVYGEPAYPYPSIYYPPPGAYIAGAAISFGVGVALGSAWHGGWGWGCGWGHNDININVNNHYVRNYNRTHVNNRIGNNSSWNHNPRHRGGAPYPNRHTADRFGGNSRGGPISKRPSGGRDHIAGGKRPRAEHTRPGGSGKRPGGGSKGDHLAGGKNRPRAGSGSHAKHAGGGGGTKRPTGSKNHIGNRHASKPSSGRSHNAFRSGGSSRRSATASHNRGASSMKHAHRGGGHRGGRRR